mmetsp:Transcript_29294/g.62050  ORF Transcript_29294/g.62050 Transcript_29294/m.62050 type:complete len:229 (-) Transcript_29294:3117-3803(-)
MREGLAPPPPGPPPLRRPLHLAHREEVLRIAVGAPLLQRGGGSLLASLPTPPASPRALSRGARSPPCPLSAPPSRLGYPFRAFPPPPSARPSRQSGHQQSPSWPPAAHSSAAGSLPAPLPAPAQASPLQQFGTQAAPGHSRWPPCPPPWLFAASLRPLSPLRGPVATSPSLPSASCSPPASPPSPSPLPWSTDRSPPCPGRHRAQLLASGPLMTHSPFSTHPDIPLLP